MSVTHNDGSFDSGRNHLVPALIAIAITALISVMTFVLSGLPH